MFWNQITQELNYTDVTNPKSVNLVLNQYLNWFGLNSESDRQKAYKRINTAYHRKKEIEDGNPEQPHNYLDS